MESQVRETREKTKQPDLKVSDGQGSAPADSEQTFAELVQEPTGETTQSDAQNSDNTSSAAKPEGDPKSAAPQDLKATSAEDAKSNAEKESKFMPDRSDMTLSDKPYRGLSRHKLIVGACMMLSLLMLGLNAFDLQSLMSREATINKRFEPQFQSRRPDIPANCLFTSNHDYSEGLIAIDRQIGRDSAFGFLDEKGNVVIKPNFANVRDFHEGLAAAQEPGENGKWGFINKSGEYMIKPQFDEQSPGDFKDGVAPVYSSVGGGNLIDKSGNALLKDRLQTIPVASGSLYIAASNSIIAAKLDVAPTPSYGVVDKTGKWVIPAKYSSIQEFRTTNYNPEFPLFHPLAADANVTHYLKIVGLEGTGVADDTGKILVEPKYENVMSFQNGHAAVAVDNKIGFVDTFGKMVIAPKYQFATAFDDVIAVKQNGVWSLIDSTGKAINTPIESIICSPAGYWFSDGYGAVVIDDMVGFVDKTGKLAIKPEYKLATNFREGYAQVWDGNWWRFIDKRGKPVSSNSRRSRTVCQRNDSSVSARSALSAGLCRRASSCTYSRRPAKEVLQDYF